MHTAPLSPCLTHLPADLCLAQGERREIDLGGLCLARVTVGCLVLHTAAGEWTEHTTLAASGDWLGAEWQNAPAVRVSVSALADTRLTWHGWDPAHATRLLTQSLGQQKQRAAELLALRSGTAEHRCRHLLKLLADAAPPHASGVGPRPLPGLKEMARLVDLAPETTCRTLARLRTQPAARAPHLPGFGPALVALPAGF